MKEGYVNTVLRKDGTVVTLTPSDGHYDLSVEDDEHKLVRPVPSEMADDPLNTPEFDSIVRELKQDLQRSHDDDAGSSPDDRLH
jgi:hypothetical protein